MLQTTLLPLLQVQNRLEVLVFLELYEKMLAWMLRLYSIDTTTDPMQVNMGEVVFATLGICRMGTTLFQEDIAQKSVIRILW